MMLVCRVEPLLEDSDRARGGGLDEFGSGSRCLYVRVRNGNAVSMQGRASQRQTGRSGLAATLFLTCRWPVRVSLRVGWDRARAEGSYIMYVMYKRKACLCLALGLPGMISFYARQHSTSCADVASLLVFFLFSSCSICRWERRAGWSVVGSRVQRGKEGLLTLCRWVGAVVCSAPTGLAGQLSWSFVWTAIVVPWSSPSQPRAKPSWGST